MPQPAELEDLQESLLQAYRRSWNMVLEEQERLATNPLAYRRRTRLSQMQRRIEGMMRSLDKQADAWINQQLPKAYRAGAANVAVELGDDLAFSTINQDALKELSGGLFEDLLNATQFVNDSTKRLVRAVAKDQALQKAIIGRTADQAAREMRRVLEENAIHAIRYADGSRHGLAEYTQVAMRTTTAKAYNAGSFAAAPEVKFWEIFDGPNCGLTYHDDPTLASGMVVDRDTGERNIISHPNCRRSFGPRPDVNSKKDAKQASPTTTPEQRVAQLEQDALRGDQEAISELEKQFVPQPADPTLGKPVELPDYAVKANREGLRNFSVDIKESKIAARYEEWGAGLSAEEREAFSRYQINSWEANKQLRAGESVVDQQLLDEAIGRAPSVGQVGDVYRTLEADVLKGLEPGDVFRDPAFLSTTIDRDFAVEFGEDSMFDEQAIMKIRLLPGERGAWIDAASTTEQMTQGELLLSRNTPLTYVGRGKEGDYLFVAAGRELPPPAPARDLTTARTKRLADRQARLR